LLFQRGQEFFLNLLARAFPRQALHLIVRNQVHLGKQPVCEGGQRPGLFNGIVHPGDQNILKRDHPAFLSLILLARRDQFLQRILAVHRHDSVAHLVGGAMQRDGEAELQRLVRQPANLRCEAAGGDGDLPGADAAAPRRVQDAQRREQVFIIGERFAHSHYDNVVNQTGFQFQVFSFQLPGLARLNT